MTKKEKYAAHKERHKELHKAFDELVADCIGNVPGMLLSEWTVMQLIEWSSKQTDAPEGDWNR